MATVFLMNPAGWHIYTEELYELRILKEQLLLKYLFRLLKKCRFHSFSKNS